MVVLDGSARPTHPSSLSPGRSRADNVDMPRFSDRSASSMWHCRCTTAAYDRHRTTRRNTGFSMARAAMRATSTAVDWWASGRGCASMPCTLAKAVAGEAPHSRASVFICARNHAVAACGVHTGAPHTPSPSPASPSSPASTPTPPVLPVAPARAQDPTRRGGRGGKLRPAEVADADPDPCPNVGGGPNASQPASSSDRPGLGAEVSTTRPGGPGHGRGGSGTGPSRAPLPLLGVTASTSPTTLVATADAAAGAAALRDGVAGPGVGGSADRDRARGDVMCAMPCGGGAPASARRGEALRGDTRARRQGDTDPGPASPTGRCGDTVGDE